MCLGLMPCTHSFSYLFCCGEVSNLNKNAVRDHGEFFEHDHSLVLVVVIPLFL